MLEYHFMKEIRFHIIVFVILVPLIYGCATAVPVTMDGIKTEMASIKKDIARNRDNIEKLKSIRVGTTGYYYVVDTDGTVVIHPQAALIGSSFKNNRFINKIIADKTGCISNQLGNRMHMVFFDQLNDSEILCLSILSDDVRSLPQECQ
jgi:hypothetical protein